jgi:hypothetical protein
MNTYFEFSFNGENYKEQTGKSRIFKAQRAELEAPARVAYEKALETIKRA